jgi:hypothetical protein
MALHCDADMVRTIVGTRPVKFLSSPAGSQSQDALARLDPLGLRPADVLAAALGGRPRPRLAVGAFTCAAAADVVLLAGGVLLTRESTRSAVSRSVSRVATAARSVSRRASRSLIFVFSALIWSNIVGVVMGIVAFSGFRSIGMIDLAGV